MYACLCIWRPEVDAGFLPPALWLYLRCSLSLNLGFPDLSSQLLTRVLCPCLP
ncbi:mCG147013 [Mus musculus]|nr:mCG147013 [Mus musculus]